MTVRAVVPMLLSLAVVAARADEPSKGEPREVTLRGEVVTMAEVLQERNIRVDREPIAGQVVLLAEDGMVTPLFSDQASRALFQDERLRHRPAELQGLIYPGIPYLLLTNVQVEQDGVFQTPEYYCDVCTIHVRYPQPCPCCQGPMELRYRERDDRP